MVQQPCQPLLIGFRLIQHDDKLRVTEHGAGLNGIQKVFHVLGDGAGRSVPLSKLPPGRGEEFAAVFVFVGDVKFVCENVGTNALGTEINTPRLLNLLHLEGHKTRNAFCSESTENIDLSGADRQCCVQSIHLLVFGDGKLTHIIQTQLDDGFGIRVQPASE